MYNMKKTDLFWAKRKSSLSVKSGPEIADITELPFKKLLMFLIIIGALPFTLKAPHNPSLHPTKSTLALAVTVYTFVLASSYSMLTFYANRLMSEEFPLYEKVFLAQIIVICLSVFITVAVWSDTPAIRRGILIWLQISRLHFKITNRVLKPRWRTLETVIVVITLIFPPTVFLIAKVAFPQLQISYFFAPACLQPLAVCFLVCALWIGYFGCLKSVAEEVNKDLNWAIKRRLLNADKLMYYHKLWLQMRALTDFLSTLIAPVVVYVTVVESVILFIYILIIYIRMGNYLGALPSLLLTASCTAMITLMVRASHVAIVEVKLLYSGILAEHQYDPMHQTSQRQAIYMYLVERTRNPTPMLGNFIVVNKALLASILGTIATHLVVLAQLTQPRESRTQPRFSGIH